MDKIISQRYEVEKKNKSFAIYGPKGEVIIRKRPTYGFKEPEKR